MSNCNKNDGFMIESGYIDLSQKKDANSPVIGYEIQGRCTNCWGRLSGRKDVNGKWDVIECRLCKELLEGNEAELERVLMYQEVEENLKRACQLSTIEYREDAKFVLKVLPDFKRDEPYVDKRIASKQKSSRTAKQKRDWLTRHDVQKGAAGYFYLQACTIMAGTSTIPRVETVIPYSEISFKELDVSSDRKSDNYYQISLSANTNSMSSRSSGNLMSNIGALMSLGMSSAFACELALKAILLTRKDEAKKTHDLLELYLDLPDDCKLRMKADFAEIEGVMTKGRYVFGNWRYFQHAEGEKGILAMVDVERAHALSKAAKVIIDEGVISGLMYEVDVKHKFEVDSDFPETSKNETYSLMISAEESAIPWDVLYEQCIPK